MGVGNRDESNIWIQLNQHIYGSIFAHNKTKGQTQQMVGEQLTFQLFKFSVALMSLPIHLFSMESMALMIHKNEGIN